MPRREASSRASHKSVSRAFLTARACLRGLESAGRTSSEASLNLSQREGPSQSKACQSQEQFAPAPKTRNQTLAVPSPTSKQREQETKSGERIQGHIYPLKKCQYIISDSIEDANKWSNTPRSSIFLRTVTSTSPPRFLRQTSLPNGKLVLGRFSSEPLLSTDTNTTVPARRVARLLSAFTPSNRRSSHQSSTIATSLPVAQNPPSSSDSNMSERPLLQSAPGKPNFRFSDRPDFNV